jgi:hypothetical protein
MAEDMHITIREALPSDADDFAELVLLSSPGLFPAIYGGGVRDLMRYLFRQRGNLFSFEHACFAEMDGKKAGMILGYDWRAKRRESWRTGYLLLKHRKGALSGKIPLLMKVNGVVGMVGGGILYKQYRCVPAIQRQESRDAVDFGVGGGGCEERCCAVVIGC